MDGTEMANWLNLLELYGSVGEGQVGMIGLGILTKTGHHYLRVPSVGTGDPAFFLIDAGSLVDQAFVIPAIPLSIRFDSDEALAAFAFAYGAAWQKEGELKGPERDALAAALRDQVAGEEKLLSLEVGEIPEALPWFHQSDPPGQSFRRCFSSTAGARRQSFAVHVELAKQVGVPSGGRRTSCALWNVASQFPEPRPKGVRLLGCRKDGGLKLLRFSIGGMAEGMRSEFVPLSSGIDFDIGRGAEGVCDGHRGEVGVPARRMSGIVATPSTVGCRTGASEILRDFVIPINTERDRSFRGLVFGVASAIDSVSNSSALRGIGVAWSNASGCRVEGTHDELAMAAANDIATVGRLLGPGT
jgi:hypothetical protein